MPTGSIDLSVLAGAITATGAMIVGVTAYIDKVKKEASQAAVSECEVTRRRLAHGIHVCGDEIDSALVESDIKSVTRLRRVQEALSI